MLVFPLVVLILCVISFALSVTSISLSSVDFTKTQVSIKHANGFAESTGPELTIALDPPLVGLLKGNGEGVELASSEDVISTPLTDFASATGDITSNDTILSGMEKMDGNIRAISLDVLNAPLTGFTPQSGTISSSTTILNALEVLDFNTPEIVTANGFAGSVGPTITLSLSPGISGLMKGTGTGVAVALDTDVTDAKLTGFVSSSGPLSSADSLLSAVEKLDGNVVAPVSQVSLLTPVDDVTPLVLDPDVDVIIIDTSNSSAVCTLDAPTFNHILTVQLQFQRGLAATIQLSSGGSFVIDQTVPLVQLFYNSGWRIFTTSTTLNSFIPNQVNAFKIVAPDTVGAASFGFTAYLSADGNTLAIGGATDDTNLGATWIYNLVANVWTYQDKLIGTGSIGATVRQSAIAISADGNTVAIGGRNDDSNTGAAWVFTRTAGVWTQQGAKIVPAGAVAGIFFGVSGALSADGNILLVTARSFGGGAGAMYVFTRSAGVWTEIQQILGSESNDNFGTSCTMSADGSIITGSYSFQSITPNVVLTFSNISGTYIQLPPFIVPPGTVFTANYNQSLSANGRVLSYGNDQLAAGSTQVYVFANNVWTQQSDNLIGTGAVGGNEFQGRTTCLSADGNTLAVGAIGDNTNVGAVWLFRRTQTNWAQFGSKIVGAGHIGSSGQGSAVALSSDGHVLAVGGSGDNSGVGAVWVYW